MTQPKAQAKAGAKADPKAPRLGKQGDMSLPGELFAEAFHQAVVWEAIRAEQAARRRGTASSKRRGEVRGGGAKPWRQKGTGRARAGSNRAPNWTGGGVAFGPSPRRYTVKVNRKARSRALRAALSLHADRGSIAVLDTAPFDEPSTKKAADTLDEWGARPPTLVLLGVAEEICAKSFRNIASASVLPAVDAGVADVAGAASVVISEDALDELMKQVSP
jgi:large subunit ribosomal protein L4